MQRISKISVANPKFIKSREPLLHHDEKHFTLPLDDKFKSSEIQQALAGLQEQERECKKRIPSNDSDGSPTRAVVARRSDHNGNQAKHEQLAREKALQNLSARRDAINIQLQQMEKTKSLIPNATDKKTRKQVKELETAIYFATCKLDYIIENFHRIIGGAQDDFVRESVHDPVGAAYVEMLLEKHIEPSSARRTFRTNKQQRKQQHEAWRTQLIQHYNAVDPKHPDRLWCPVARSYISSKQVKAAHIVPNSLGEHHARHIFGSPKNRDTGHLYDIGNGFMLHSEVEEAIDRARIAIVPANIVIEKAGSELTEHEKAGSKLTDDEKTGSELINDEKADSEFIIVILDKSVETNQVYPGLTFADLANRKLEFKHPTNRPRLRYLYYAFCASLLTRQRHDCEDWQKDWARLLHKRFWGTPEKGWIRHSSMAAILKRMGAAKDMYAILNGGEMPTGELAEDVVPSMGEWDDRTAVAVQKTSMELRLRAEGIIDGETDEEDDDIEGDD